MNENITEQIEEMETQIGNEETGKGVEESQQNNWQGDTVLPDGEPENGENLSDMESVSDGDSVVVYTTDYTENFTTLEEILSGLEEDAETLISNIFIEDEETGELHTYQEEADLNIFEKSLSKYTVTESLLLLIFLLLLTRFIFDIIGGIIKCEI